MSATRIEKTSDSRLRCGAKGFCILKEMRGRPVCVHMFSYSPPLQTGPYFFVFVDSFTVVVHLHVCFLLRCSTRIHLHSLTSFSCASYLVGLIRRKITILITLKSLKPARNFHEWPKPESAGWGLLSQCSMLYMEYCQHRWQLKLADLPTQIAGRYEYALEGFLKAWNLPCFVCAFW